MNYTNGELITKNGEFSVIEKPDFIDEIYGSWNKTNITQIL